FNPFLEAGTGFFVRSADILPRDPFAPIDLRSSLDFEPVLWAGLGLDVRLGRSFTLGTRVRHERVGRFAESPNMPADISQTAVSISFGFLLGGGKKP
ncbi:MAG TPA: hypothetical protein VFO85_12725, partial [Vicinamibacteria bacterium]|nr:hypothetical protein [Vicinamibacteria bacterium]